jgi:plasmid stability protein
MDEKITIELDEAALEELRRLAVTHGRSIDEEAQAIVAERVGHRPKSSPEDSIRRAREIRAMTPKGVVQTDSVALIREDRDR